MRNFSRPISPKIHKNNDIILSKNNSGITVGAWKKVKWVHRSMFGIPLLTAVVVLTGVPHPLRERIETDLGNSIRLRWRWKGLSKAQDDRTYAADYGVRSTWLTAESMMLDFVEGDTVLWTFR